MTINHETIPEDFKGKINWLFEHIKKADGTPYSSREAGLAIGKTENYIWRLRTDPRVNNPSLQVVIGLAAFFRVGLNIFEPKPISPGDIFGSEFLGQMAMRAPAMDELDEADQDALIRIIDHVLNSKQKEQD